MRAIVMGLVMVLLSVACTQGADSDSGSGNQTAQSSATPQGSATPRASATPQASPTPQASETPRADVAPPSSGQGQRCSDLVFGEIDAAVSGQLAAFASGDFAEALTYATPDFRRSHSPRTFEEIIVTRFPVPAGAQSHETGHCALDGQAAVALVEVTAAEGSQTLQYLLEKVAGRWLIGGAIPLTDDASAGGPVI